MKSGEGSFLHSVEQMIDDAIERMDLAGGLVDQVEMPREPIHWLVAPIDRVRSSAVMPHLLAVLRRAIP